MTHPPITRLTLAVEGRTDEIVGKRLLQHCGFKTTPRIRDAGGQHNLLKHLPKYNEAARVADYEGSVSLYVVLLDLDDRDCVKTYIETLVEKRSRRLLLRIAVREIESWLMADRERFAQFVGVAVENMPLNPDEEDDPKATLFSLVHKGTGKTALQRDMLPAPGAPIGQGYVSRIRAFVEGDKWRPDVAATHSESLSRCIQALRQWV